MWKWINPDGLRFVRCCLEQCRDASCDCAEIEKRKGVVKIGVKIDPFRYTSAGSGGVEKEDGLPTVWCKGATQMGLISYIPITPRLMGALMRCEKAKSSNLESNMHMFLFI